MHTLYVHVYIYLHMLFNGPLGLWKINKINQIQTGQALQTAEFNWIYISKIQKQNCIQNTKQNICCLIRPFSVYGGAGGISQTIILSAKASSPDCLA